MVLEPDTGWCASEDAKLRKGWTLGGVPARMLGPERGWIVRSHIDWGEEQVPARMLDFEEGWIVRTHIGWGGERNILDKGVETSPSRHVLKTLRGSPKEKSKEDNIC